MPQVWSAPVRFVECDQQGVAFNAHYLVWADEALTPWWIERGIDWERFVATYELRGRRPLVHDLAPAEDTGDLDLSGLTLDSGRDSCT